ncbi:MarR family winged helix-turn-helix transcriptional regulator [Flexithrix dorotheae]|uniref:MarR family winged helix-turn-helix transcriptional regulator n=1 Tax=Flexithrix dorotheae TaxID=70993 RepID=UPI0003674933|nr:MarR family transcriptional regulator [Flexithrix dorotheae]
MKKKEDILNLEHTLLPWMGRTMKVLDYFIGDFLNLKGIELTKVQWILLKKLNEQNGQPQQNLAFLTNRDKASLARLITTMEKKKLVERIPSKIDGRINHIFITKHGCEILQKSAPVIEKVVGCIQEGISPEEIETVIKVMQKVNNNINRASN